MNQSLLTARGAQPLKPSRYKPVWTDRFFTGYFTNRSPFRSPLSAFYADGWQLGKTDTLIDGLNVEVSPRLTLIRRPGALAWNSERTIADAPIGFYSFHRQDGTVAVFADTRNSIWQITSDNSIFGTVYNKPNPGSGRQSFFHGIGNTLYVMDGVDSVALDIGITGWQNNVRNMGIAAPNVAPQVSIAAVNHSSAEIAAAQFDGATNYVSTADQITIPQEFTIEAWVKTATTSAPILSFEQSQTGNSPQVYYCLYLDANGYLAFGIYDSTNNVFNVQTLVNGIKINDNLWHHISISFTYQDNTFEAIQAIPGTPVAATKVGVSQFTPDPTVFSNFTYTHTPTVSSGGHPGNSQAFVFIDGQFVGEYDVIEHITTSATGYWRIGNVSTISEATFPSVSLPTNRFFAGLIAYVSVYNGLVGGVGDRVVNMTGAGTAAYANRTLAFGPQYFWELQEASGTVAADSAGSNTGTYQNTFTLHQTAPIVYVSYATNTAFTEGQIVVDSNGYLQQVSAAGTTGTSSPSWNTSLGGATIDGTVVWINRGQASLNLSTPQGTKYCFCYVSKTGHFSTASPLTSATGPQTGVKITVSGLGSWDAQAAYIAIFRTADGGATPFFVGAIPVSVGQNWSFTDTAPDSSLNILMAAPRDHSNDPPPVGAINLTYHMGRMWCSVGGILYASGGPDTLVGSGNEAWPPANSWTFPARIVRLVPTSSGLLVFTTAGIQILAGGPAIAQFYPQELIAKVGLLSPNALDVNGSRITLFTADKQLVSIDPSVGLSDLGFPIADRLAQLDPTRVYVVDHHSGLDNAIYIGDGSTGWYRCNPQQAPDYQITGPVWSPKATVNGGFCGALASVETSPGLYELLIGDPRDNEYVLARDSAYTTFTDAGGSYDAYFTVGSIVLANPGEIAELGFITCDFNKVGNRPQLNVLMDEIAGTFSSISAYVVSDPPILFGATGAPASLYSNRYYFKQGTNPIPAFCRHMQIKCDFGNDAAMNEIFTMTIFGAILVEGA